MNRNSVAKLRETRSARSFTDGANFYPLDQTRFDDDLVGLIREFVLPGHAPSRPLLRPTDNVITLGSCFANHVNAHLLRCGYRSDGLGIPDHLTTSHAILEFVSWSVTGRQTERGYRYPTKMTRRSREDILKHMRSAGGFVFTFGLAEIWEEVATGQTFWRGVPRDIFDPERHRFRVTTVEENVRDVLEMLALVRIVNADAPIVVTLSPVPLKATWRDISCLTADCVSKATLRLTLDSVLSQEPANVHYWPSFEIVRWLGSHRSEPSFGVGTKDARHVNQSLVATITELFVDVFYGDPTTSSNIAAVN